MVAFLRQGHIWKSSIKTLSFVPQRRKISLTAVSPCILDSRSTTPAKAKAVSDTKAVTKANTDTENTTPELKNCLLHFNLLAVPVQHFQTWLRFWCRYYALLVPVRITSGAGVEHFQCRYRCRCSALQARVRITYFRCRCSALPVRMWIAYFMCRCGARWGKLLVLV